MSTPSKDIFLTVVGWCALPAVSFLVGIGVTSKEVPMKVFEESSMLCFHNEGLYSVKTPFALATPSAFRYTVYCNNGAMFKLRLPDAGTAE